MESLSLKLSPLASRIWTRWVSRSSNAPVRRCEWQKVDKLRILIGDEVSQRTKKAFESGLAEIAGKLDRSLEAEKESNDFLSGVPSIVKAIRSGKIQCKVYRKDKFHAKAYITHARVEVIGASALVDSAHGTNPASAALGGYAVVTIPSDASGDMDIDLFKKALNDETAGVMLTLPSTLGVFNPRVKEIIKAVHEVDGLMYYDGANFNAIMGRIKPGELGFDLCHLNLHKSFSTPHGGGGPGTGPVGVSEKLRPYHAPTIYFPLNVPEAIMIEPTETETRETLDAFCADMIELFELSKTDPDALHHAPVTTQVGRLDEVAAAKNMELVYARPENVA